MEVYKLQMQLPLLLALALVIIAIAMPVVYSESVKEQEEGEVHKWIHRHPTPEKVTRLHFYFHEMSTGKNPSTVRIAQAPSSSTSETHFGWLMMMDDPLTEGPDPKSKVIGRAQGLYGFAGREELGDLILASSFAFTVGKYSGSTLTLLGLNPTAHLTREIPIVGGTGIFRLARGVAALKTYNNSEFNTTYPHPHPHHGTIVEYNILVVHY